MKKLLKRVVNWTRTLTRKRPTSQEMANKRREGTATQEDLCQ